VTRREPAEPVRFALNFDLALSDVRLGTILPNHANPGRFSKIAPNDRRLDVLPLDGLGVNGRKQTWMLDDFSGDKSFHRFPFLFELAGKNEILSKANRVRG
jgi:hypothetical protein